MSFLSVEAGSKRAGRPRPSIEGRSRHTALLSSAQDIALRLADKPGVVGVVLAGGVARGYADELSELDLIVYLDPDAVTRWAAGAAPYPAGDALADGIYTDISYVDWSAEAGGDWPMVKRWDRSYAVVLHDPAGRVHRLYREKVPFGPGEVERLAGQYLSQCDAPLFNDLPSWLRRQDFAAAHLALNRIIPALVALAFLANAELIPSDKWALHLSRTLAWQPADWQARIEGLIQVKAASLQDAERRRALALGLHQELGQRCLGPEVKTFPISYYASRYQILASLLKEGSLPLAEFSRRFGAWRLMTSPACYVLKLNGNGDGRYVSLDTRAVVDLAAGRGGVDLLQWDHTVLVELAKLIQPS